MARHRTQQEERQLGELARALRAQGRSRREIQAELGVGDDLAKQLLAGADIPDSLRRPRAKDDVRDAAIDLRAAGATYDEIAAALDVSKSTCSLWLRDQPRPEEDADRAAAARARRLTALRARARRDGDVRDEAGRQLTAEVAEGVEAVTSRDLVLALAVSYWCEGSRRRPWSGTRWSSG